MNSGDTAWVLASAALVLLMTPGLAFFYGGMVRSKNVLGMLMQNFATIGIVSVVWVLVSYSLAFGGDNAYLGGFHFAGLKNMDQVVPGYEGSFAQVIPPIVFVGFQLMFAVITPALITGGTADRWKFPAFLTFVIIWSIVVYAPIAHWVFSPTGWLFKRGALDFAGGTVVHANAGIAAVAVVLVLGKRRGWPTIVAPGSYNGYPWANFNKVLLAETANRPNVNVLGWVSVVASHPEWLASDGIHVSGVGYQTRAHLVAAAIDQCP